MRAARNAQLSPAYALSSPSSPAASPAMSHTIRTVPSFDTPSDTSYTPSRNSGFSSSVNSTASMSSSHDQPLNVRLKQPSFNGDATIRASASPRREDPSPVDDDVPLNGPGQAWDSTIGKAGLGKTGRVINKLVSDNDSLKRDLKLEKLRADEARQSAKLLEDKMERVISDYESRLLEANVTKTLLARKERQVETLTASVDLEKNRADTALERERGWRDEMEKMRLTTTRQVDDASAHAALMEGRYNAIASHWKDQGDDVKKAHSKLRSEIAGLVAERRHDDDKITTLRDLCDQQDGNIRELKRQRDEMTAAFEEYKRQQDGLLAGIKEAATQREKEQERLLAETTEVLHKLRWALNVKENVKDAQ